MIGYVKLILIESHPLVDQISFLEIYPKVGVDRFDLKKNYCPWQTTNFDRHFKTFWRFINLAVNWVGHFKVSSAIFQIDDLTPPID